MSIETILFIILGLIISVGLGFAYRAHGGGISLGPNKTMLARFLLWALPVTVVCSGLTIALHAPLWLAPLCGLAALGGACIGHSSFQTDSSASYIHMGAYTMGLLGLILAPLMAYSIWQDAFEVQFLSALPMGFLGGLFASWLGYRMNSTLKLFGITWCRPPAVGGSEWEEIYIGVFAFGVPLSFLAATLVPLLSR